MLGLGKGKKRKMKGGREGLRNHLDLGISSAFSVSRRKTNFFFNLEMAECMNGILETPGENAFLFVLKMHFYMRNCNAWNRYSRVISLCTFAVLNVFMKSKKFSWLGSNGWKTGEEQFRKPNLTLVLIKIDQHL